jgi:hypothetical protein
MAGIEDDEIGVLRRCGRDITHRRQHIGHALAVVHVHLAAERLDMKALRRRYLAHA